MLKQLWVRLTLAFVAVTLIAVLTVAMFANTQAGQSFQQYLNRRDVLAQSGYLDELAAYYQRTGSWVGVESVFGSLNPGTPGRGRGGQGGQGFGQGGMGGRPTIMLADSERRIVYDERGGRAATSISDDELAYTLPINVDGKTVGYLAVVPGRGTGLQPPEENFLTQLRETLLLAALVAGLVGIALGLIISRTLAAPLARLSQAARALAARDWSRRVEVQGAAEIAEVGQAFNAMADELQRAETLRRNLVAEIAHELRTPLTVMQGNLRAILDGVYPLERHEIATLYDETRLLSRLVNDLHELALADAGQLPLNMQARSCQGVDRPEIRNCR
jgi:two-component system OmpR family sensor kinase/two-component system sensor histidine kinase BaeS